MSIYKDVYPCDLRNNIECSPGKILIIHINIRSIQKNVDELKIFLADLNTEVHIITLSECWLQEGVKVVLDGFSAVQSTCGLNKASGVMIFVNNKLSFEIINTNNQMNFDSLFIKIDGQNMQKHSTVVGVIYRSPTSDVNIFLANLRLLLIHLVSLKDALILTGDWNINMQNIGSPISHLLADIAADSALIQIIETPTRVTGNCSSILHVIFVNQKMEYLHVRSRTIAQITFMLT